MTFRPWASVKKKPPLPINLRALYSIGLWLAVTATPPAAPALLTANSTYGVVAIPISIISQPDAIKPAAVAFEIIGP